MGEHWREGRLTTTKAAAAAAAARNMTSSTAGDVPEVEVFRLTEGPIINRRRTIRTFTRRRRANNAKAAVSATIVSSSTTAIHLLTKTKKLLLIILIMMMSFGGSMKIEAFQPTTISSIITRTTVKTATTTTTTTTFSCSRPSSSFYDHGRRNRQHNNIYNNDILGRSSRSRRTSIILSATTATRRRGGEDTSSSSCHHRPSNYDDNRRRTHHHQYQKKKKTSLVLRMANSDDDDDGNNEQHDDTHDHNSEKVNSQKKMFISTAFDDFWYGATYVHTQYLRIVWKYAIKQSLIRVVVPFALVLWTSYFYSYGALAPAAVGGGGNGGGIGLLTSTGSTVVSTSVAATTATATATTSSHMLFSIIYNTFYGMLNGLLKLSSFAEYILQCPFVVLSYFVRVVIPTVLTYLLDYLPIDTIAVPLIHGMLWFNDNVIQTIIASRVGTFLTSLVASVLWRPLLEEWQYRSFLNKIVFGIPQACEDVLGKMYHSTGYYYTPTPKTQPKRSNQKEGGQSSEEEKATTTSFVEFIPLDSTTSSSESQSSASSSLDQRPSWMYFPKIPDESMRILLGSLLYATTRLCWLSCVDPTTLFSTTGHHHHHHSTYSWTVGFIESIMRHLSPSVLTSAQVAPKVQIWVMLLAIYESVSTFLVAQKVFAVLYRKRGLAASVGAHCSWTINKITLPVRIVRKVYKSIVTTNITGTSKSSMISDETSNQQKVGTQFNNELI